MKINSVDKTNFGSKANPVAPFIIRTKRGRLTVAEISQKDLRRDGFIQKLTRFFCKNFASLTKDPNWQVFKRGYGADYDIALLDLIRYYSARIKSKDENMTLLIAKDKRNKIQGACLSYGYDRIPNQKNRVCYIDSIAVNSSYRGYDVGRLLLEKTLDSARNKFTDAFLSGDRCAFGFYNKLGFKPLNKKDKAQDTVIDYISKRRSDYPKYVDFFNLPLKEDEERWYRIASKEIESEK